MDSFHLSIGNVEFSPSRGTSMKQFLPNDNTLYRGVFPASVLKVLTKSQQ
jgi:hypothetical protein